MLLIKQMKKYRKNISIINQEECASIHIHTHSMESLDPDHEYVLLLRLQEPYVLIGKIKLRYSKCIKFIIFYVKLVV